MFNFLGEKGQGLTGDFLDKCRNVKYSVRLAPILNYIFNDNIERIAEIKQKIETLKERIRELEIKNDSFNFAQKQINSNLLKINSNDAVSLTIFSAIDNTEFVKFITEVQDKNSNIMPLAEMMILRDLMDNRKEQLSELSRKVQKSLDETKKSCNELVNSGLIEIVGKEYMLTAKVYEALKSDVEYTRDKTVQYIKAKNMILEYLQTNDQITSAKIQEMCGFTKQQARSVIDKMRSEDLITLTGKGPAARYVMYK